MKKYLFIVFILWSTSSQAQVEMDIVDRVTDHYANNEGVKIHYVSIGEGPVILMLHGFPDYWYTWRYQMEVLSKTYKVIAVDLRGYNTSDKPKGVSNYTMRTLMEDIILVMDDAHAKEVTLIGNDWGGAIAWQLATYYPNRIKGLIACNIPHPNGLVQYLQQYPSTGQYAEDFKKKHAEEEISVESLVALHNNLSPTEMQRYAQAFKNSDFEAMLNYYKASYPSASKQTAESPTIPSKPFIKINSPVLVIYGMQDKALPPGMLNNTWDWIDNELTICTIPNAGHFIQQEKPELVNKIILNWLYLNANQ